tara:strand:+ start:2141 stop:2695 length:555 start_codon:yes stop_codon:yes gene_type:complete
LVKEFNIRYSIIDIETTGGKFNQEKITEIAILRIDESSKVDVFHKLINPIKRIQPFVEKLTRLNNKMLENKPKFSNVAVEIQDFTKNSIFVAHNVNFDYRVLRKEFKSVGIEFLRKTLCTIKLSKKAFPLEKSYGLGKLTSRIGIKINDRHRAIGDAEATLKLFKMIRKKLSEDDIRKYITEYK